MFTTLTNVQLALMLLQVSPGPRDYTEHTQYPKYKQYMNKKPTVYKSKHMRRNHQIKQPGIDIQRRSR